MTTPSTPRKAGPYLGDGTQTTWTFEFKVFAESDIAVTIADAVGDKMMLTLNSDYTVELNENQETSPGGTVTYPLPPGPGDDPVPNLPTGSRLSIIGNVPYEQTLDIPTGGNFNPIALENQLDRTTMQVQQLAEELSRAVRIPVTYDADELATFTADVIRLADSADNIDTLAANVNDIATVADDLNLEASNITAVAQNIADVVETSGGLPEISVVAADLAGTGYDYDLGSITVPSTGTGTSPDSAIIAVATNIADVQTAAANLAAIIAAPTEAANAASSATDAAASASAAAAIIASGMYSAVQDKSTNYTVVEADAGDLIRVTTSGGARTITLPAISSLDDGFKVSVVKWTNDNNAVTVARSGSDTINGAADFLLTNQYNSATFVADAETSQWFAAGSGAAGTNVVVDRFSANGSTTVFTLSGNPGSENNTQVFINGVYQQKDGYSQSGATLTFGVAPPSGTDNVEVVWTQPLAIGVPSDNTVSAAKLVDGAVTSAKLGSGAVVAHLGYTPANDSTVNSALALKADTSTVNSALALKANTSTVNSALALKADTSAVNTALALKLDAANPNYTGTLTGGTGVINIGSGQFYKDAAGQIGLGTTTPQTELDVNGQISGKFSDLGTNTTAMDLATNHVAQVTVSIALTLTTTVPPAGTTAYVIIIASGVTSRTVTFGTGFKTTATLATGTTSTRRFVVTFISDGVNLVECARTAAVVY